MLLAMNLAKLLQLTIKKKPCLTIIVIIFCTYLLCQALLLCTYLSNTVVRLSNAKSLFRLFTLCLQKNGIYSR